MSTRKIRFMIYDLRNKDSTIFGPGYSTLTVKENGQLKVVYGNQGSYVWFSIPNGGRVIKKISHSRNEKYVQFLYQDNKGKSLYTIGFINKEDYDKLIKIFKYWGIYFK